VKGDELTVVEEVVDVQVPVTTAYNQWTQFETFPQFMDGIVEVRQLDDTHVHWVAEVRGERREWDAKILRQEPDRVIQWQSLDEHEPSGEVSFEPIDASSTRVTVHMEYEPIGTKEKVGSMLGIDDRHVKKDLERFKELIESRGTETGAWRAEVVGGENTTSERMGSDADTTGKSRAADLSDRPTNPH
jgi:uncharacterized membrane protein